MCVLFTARCLMTASMSTWFRIYWEERSCWTEFWGCQISRRETPQPSCARWPKLWSIYTHRGWDGRAQLQTHNSFQLTSLVPARPCFIWFLVTVSSLSRSYIETWNQVTFVTVTTADSQNPSGYVILLLPSSSELRTAYWWPRVTLRPSWLLRYTDISRKTEFNLAVCSFETMTACVCVCVWGVCVCVGACTCMCVFVFSDSEEAGLWCSLRHLEPGNPAVHHDSWVSFYFKDVL